MAATKRDKFGTVIFLLVVVAILGVLRLRLGGVAPTPEAFVDKVSLDEALARSEQTGKPVLVMATADWCGPCQSLKRGALSDPEVSAWIGEHAIAVYADFTDGTTEEAQRAGRLLGIEAYPTLVLLRDGEVVGRRVGVLPADELLGWLRSVGGA